MEKICRHIENLLAQHDYVVVPNFGGFVVQSQSAIILHNSIRAPKDTIGFNPLMHHSDGLLAMEIAKSESISYRSAMELIESTVRSMNQKLQNSGTIDFGNLGTFEQNLNGNIHFQPNLSPEFLPQNFGLIDIRVAERSFDEQKIKKQFTISLPSQNVYKYAAAAVLVFGLLFVTPDVNDVRNTNSADFASYVELNNTSINLKPEPIVALQKDTIPKDTVVVKKEVIEINKYHVIVASLPTKESAENYYQTLKMDDFNKANIVASSSKYRIAIQSFNNREKAIEFMENLRKTDSRFETAWVLCN